MARWQPVTVGDVAFTVAHLLHVPNSPASCGSYVSIIARTEVIGPLTIRLHMKVPKQNQTIHFALIGIVSCKRGEGANTQDYNSGKPVTGTGPYRFTRFIAGDRVEMARNDACWG